MIELAPNHKIGLPIAIPLMPAAGFWGYGQSHSTIIQPNLWGAVVTNPITLRPLKIFSSPYEIEDSIITPHPPGNAGVKKVIRENKKAWCANPVPIIAHLTADAPNDIFRTARALDSTGCIAGFEIGFTAQDTPADITAVLRAVMRGTELPVLAKIPAVDGTDSAAAALDAGADALTLDMHPPTDDGLFFGRGMVVPSIPVIQATRKKFPEVPLVVSCSLHTASEVYLLLDAGATAVQLDTILFINPMESQKILEEINHDHPAA